ncbi:non-specific serine,threonine protein kinase [Sarracenia purpurea var. burkii]
MEGRENAYSPNGVLEDYLRTIESETVSSKASTSETELQQSSKHVSRWHGFVQLLKSRSKKPLASLHPLSGLKLSRRISSSVIEEDIKSSTNPLIETDLSNLKPRRINFTLSELQVASNCFSHENLIGKGGYAEVYKGRLQNGQLVAIKRLTRGQVEERIGNFLSELGIMAHVNHPNTAKLIGYGVEGGMYIVLELSPHGSLTSLLHHGSKEKLKWSIRYKVAVGTAEGLLYLHEGCRRRIIHRDIKAANILLTEHFEPQDNCFRFRFVTLGLQNGFQNSGLTIRYLAPEYLMHGIVDEKTDVFAFGVLLLELITGRRALDYSKQSLVIWARPLLKKNNVRELVDPSLGVDYNPLQMKLMVVLLLKGSHGSLEVVKKYQKPAFWKRYYVELFTAEEETFDFGSLEHNDKCVGKEAFQ